MFASEIIVLISDRFHNGAPENEHAIKNVIANLQGVNIRRQHVDTTKKEQHVLWWKLRRILRLPVQSGSQYWLSRARLAGYRAVSKKSDYVLMLDADEIVDALLFKHWLDTKEYRVYDAMKFANYWYFRKPSLQAIQLEDSPLMVRCGIVSERSFFSYSDRQGIFESVKGVKKRMITGIDGKPMVHHYGWVRPKREMLTKVKTWGHNREVDWISLVEKEFTHGFNGTDFVQGYRFRKVRPFISFPDV